jgi:hypothetical protein
VPVRACGFESHLRHSKNYKFILEEVCMFLEKITQLLTPGQWGIFWLILAYIFSIAVALWLDWSTQHNPKSWGWKSIDELKREEDKKN